MPPIVEETVEVDQNFLLERIQERTVVQTVVAPALQVVAPFPDVAVGDTGFDSTSSWCMGRCERCDVFALAIVTMQVKIRVIHVNEDPSDWRSGSW